MLVSAMFSSASALDWKNGSRFWEPKRRSNEELLPIASSLRENLKHCLMMGKGVRVGMFWSCGGCDGGIGGCRNWGEDCKNLGLRNILISLKNFSWIFFFTIETVLLVYKVCFSVFIQWRDFVVRKAESQSICLGMSKCLW